VLAEEVNTGVIIEELSVQRSPGDTCEGIFYDFAIYLALTDLSMLSSGFAENYTPGTRECVFQRDSIVVSSSGDEWADFFLSIHSTDTPAMII